jgi:hypothetical protein
MALPLFEEEGGGRWDDVVLLLDEGLSGIGKDLTNFLLQNATNWEVGIYINIEAPSNGM